MPLYLNAGESLCLDVGSNVGVPLCLNAGEPLDLDAGDTLGEPEVSTQMARGDDPDDLDEEGDFREDRLPSIGVDPSGNHNMAEPWVDYRKERVLSTDGINGSLRPHVVEGYESFSISFGATTKKCGDAGSYTMPFSYRRSMGAGTELQVNWSGLKLSERHLGVQDASVGAKWNFYENGPHDLAVVGFVEFPTGSTRFCDRGLEPGVVLSYGYDFSAGWSIYSCVSAQLINGSDSNDVSVPFVKLQWAAQIAKAIDKTHELFLSTRVSGPDGCDNHVNTMGVSLGHSWALGKRNSLSFTIDKGLSSFSTDWGFTLGWSRIL